MSDACNQSPPATVEGSVSLAVIFPGQGTQSPGMGAAWVDDPAWSLVEAAEEALGQSLARLLLTADAAELGHTRNSQLCVFLVSMMAWDTVRHSIEAPVVFAGHSLGQLTSLVASGVLGFDDGIRLVARRAECTQAAADAKPGRMAALIGSSPGQALEACQAAPEACWVANDNAPGQLVVGGTPDGVEAASARARDLGVRRIVALDVGAAFHTPLMARAALDLRPTLSEMAFASPDAPVVANTDAAAHSDANWADRLERHLVSPVRWRESMLTLAGLGATSFLEVGPGAVLAGLARRTVPSVTTRSVGAPADVNDLLEVV